MNRLIRSLFIAIVLCAAGMTLAHSHKDDEKVKVISTGDIKEKLDGKDAKMTVVEVTLEPGKSGVAHRHPGPGFVYVLEGEYELGIDNQPTKIFQFRRKKTHSDTSSYLPTM
jgi:quercetin dioxygenase-like cupin family protein